MTSTEEPVLRLDALKPGDRVQVWGPRGVDATGTVEQSAPHLNVVWIREDILGERVMIDLQEAGLRAGP